MIEFVDTHCHVHFPDYQLDPDEVRKAAAKEGVKRLICVGCTLSDSAGAVEYAASHDDVWATIGLHPHEANRYVHDHKKLQQFRNLVSSPKVVAIGETGLDYYYEHSPREAQKKLLRFQLDLAAEHDLPLVFHIRDAQHQDVAGSAYQDFWQIFDEYKGLRGVVHSFSATEKELAEILKRGLYVGLNGIMTFTRDSGQLAAAKAVPLDKLLLETDAPFLTPVPFRGKICEPRHVKVTAEFLSDLRGETLKELATATTRNARKLFSI